MEDAEQDTLAAVEGIQRPVATSQQGIVAEHSAAPEDVARESLRASNEEDYAALADEVDRDGDPVEEEDGKDETDELLDELPAMRSGEAEMEIPEQDEDDISREDIAHTRHEEPASDEPDMSTMDAPALRELILQMRTDHNQQLQAEERTRAEVEDMCLRIEKHFKAEKAARAKAEELLQRAIENELSAKGQLDMEQQRLGHVENEIDMEREKVRQERDALEDMRVDFEHELQHAQTEVAKAQDALKTAEDRVRASEQVERQKIISDYELRLMSLANELLRANHDTQLRTTYMSREMQRYQNAAAVSANAVAAAKQEMHARRQDVDAMRNKLDLVMDRLAIGTEAASVLQANMASGQDHAGQLFADPYGMSATGLATLMPGNPNFQSGIGQQMLLGAPKSLVRKDVALVAPAAAIRKAAEVKTGAKTVPAGNLLPGNLNNSMQSARHTIPAAKAPVQGRTAGARGTAGKHDSRFDGPKVRHENVMAATMANW